MGKLAKKGSRSKVAYVSNEIPQIETVPASTVEEPVKLELQQGSSGSTSEYLSINPSNIIISSYIAIDSSERTNIFARIYQIFRFIFTGRMRI